MHWVNAAGYSLLSGGPAGLPSAGSAVHQCLPKLIRTWWAVSTSPSFRSSWLSRRKSIQVLLPLFAGLALMDDIRLMDMDRTESLKLLSLDVFLLASTFGTCCYSLDAWRLDWYVCITNIIYLLAWFSSHHSDSYGGGENSMFVSMCWNVVFSFTGVHSCMCFAAGCGCATHQLFRGRPGDAATVLMFAGCLSFATALTEYCNGRSFKELEEWQAATNHLLDSASDGFCSVDVGTGEIVSSSARLAKTFGAVGATGAFVAEWAAGDGDRELLDAMLQSARSGSDIHPRLITCRRPPAWGGCARSAVFDGKVIPFKVLEKGGGGAAAHLLPGRR